MVHRFGGEDVSSGQTVAPDDRDGPVHRCFECASRVGAAVPINLPATKPQVRPRCKGEWEPEEWCTLVSPRSGWKL